MKRDPMPLQSAADPQLRSLTVLSAQDVAAQLRGRERELIDLAARAYVTHGRGQSCLPQSEYLRFPGKARERIIPKAGWLGGDKPVAGIKWIASFPDNVAQGLPRASALIVLNDVNNGRPTTVMEGSLISCQRTAAGAALAARVLHQRPAIATLGLIGCGPIGRETMRFILADERPVASILLYDLHPASSRRCLDALRAAGFQGSVTIANNAQQLVQASDVLVLATSAVTPSLESIAPAPAHATILHVSLRDFTPAAVLQADNLADDIQHVLQAQTSVHQTAQVSGNADFLRGTLAQVLQDQLPARLEGRPLMFHPFGLAALDLAFAMDVAERCADAGLGLRVPEFLV